MSNNNNMPKPDIALKELFKDNDIYAAVFNGYFFNSEMVIDPNDLKPADTADTNETEIEGSVMALAGILAGDSHLYKAAKGERRQKMCRVLAKRDERIYSQFKDQLEERDAAIEAKDAAIEENRKAMEAKDAAIEENRKAMEEKDAEIAALKAQIWAMQK